MKSKVIVLRKGDYLLELLTENYIPNDIVLRFPESGSGNDITLRNLVKITLTNPVAYNTAPFVIVEYKGISLVHGSGNMEGVLSNILTFKDFSKQELESLKEDRIEEKNNQSINFFEKKITQLNLEKEILEKEVYRLKTIKNSIIKVQESTNEFLKLIEHESMGE